MIVKLCNAAELPPEGQLRLFRRSGAGASALCVGVSRGAVFAVANACPHQGAELAAGKLDGADLVCPVHGWRWNALTGAPLRSGDPALACFEVRQYGQEVFVRLPAGHQAAAEAP